MERIREQSVEAELFDDTGNWNIPPSQIGVPVMLASICRVVDCCWARVPDLGKISSARDNGVLCACRGSIGISSKKPPWVRAFLLGVVSAVSVLLGKFAWESNPAVYAGVGVLAISSMWNAWPHRVTVAQTCCAEDSINERR